MDATIYETFISRVLPFSTKKSREKMLATDFFFMTTDHFHFLLTRKP